MSAADRLSRLLALVPWLVAHPGATVRQCAAHFGVSAQQVESDLFALIVSGDEMLGAGGLVDIQFWQYDDAGEPYVDPDSPIEVIAPQSLDRPMRLTTTEAAAILIGLRLLDQLPGVPDRAAIASAAAKIEQAPSPAQARTGSGDVSAISVEVAVRPAVRAAVDDALATGSELEIAYAAGTSGAITQRRIVPAGILAIDGIAYLDAFCRFAGARRRFRLDRVLEAAAVPPGEPVGEADGAQSPVPDLAVVLDLDPAARWVADVHRGTVLDERADGGCRVRLDAFDPQWVVRLVLSLAGSAAVVEPPELAESVADAARAALAAYPDA